MSASTTDKITDTRNAGRPNSARATGTRSSGGLSLACDNLAGWPTSSKVHFVTYQIDSTSAVVAGTQLDCTGIVTGNSIGNLAVIDGTDTGNSVGDVVEMLPTAAWGQDLATALTHQHDRIGNHVGINNTGGLTTDTMTATGNAIVGGTLGVTGTTSLTGAISGAGYSLGTISNPYKFRAYRNAAANTGNGAFAVLVTDTEQYDTGSNFSAGVFTAPITGYYQFNGAVNVNSATADTTLSLFKNGTEYSRGGESQATNAGLTVSDLIPLTAGDTVDMRVYAASTKALNVANPAMNYISGYLVSAT